MLVWETTEEIKGKVHTVFSDKLIIEDNEKYNNLMNRNFGSVNEDFNGKKPEDIENFLSDYFDEKVKLFEVHDEGTNQSTGWPVWRFKYTDEPSQP